MADFFVALGLVFILEGVVCAAFPRYAKRAAATVLETPEVFMRVVGLVSALVGLGVIWAIRG
jgi:uncharacterized protein YjeT (DUF2065 family)